ncbi:hypothetical protein NQ318_014708, partial [Aromia moschata]
NDGVKERGLFDFLFSPCKCRCGVPNREARILGGEYTKGHEFPWAALIQIKDTRSSLATLINDKYLLTAATNLIGLTPLDIKITVGQFDSPGNRAHDIALIKLSTPINIERRISPICLSIPNTQYLGQVATTFGWIEDETKDGPISVSCRPRKLGLPVLGPSECAGAALEPQYVSDDKGCMGVVGVPSPIC